MKCLYGTIQIVHKVGLEEIEILPLIKRKKKQNNLGLLMIEEGVCNLSPSLQNKTSRKRQNFLVFVSVLYFCFNASCK